MNYIRGMLSVICLLAVAVLGLIGYSFVQTGEPVVVIERSGAPVTAHIVFQNGATSPATMHYAEHLSWLNAVGGTRTADRHSNAWTSDVAVGYWLSGTPEDLPELLEALKGVFDPIELPGKFAEEERDIVLREYQFRMSNNPDAQAAEAIEAFLYHGNAISGSPIGTPEEIMALDYDMARAAHAATHVPQNARLVVIGNVSERQVRRAMRESGWPEADAADMAPPPFDLAAPDRMTLRYPEPDAALRLIWRRVVALPEPVPFDLLEAQTALLREILGTNLAGGLARPLHLDAAIARSFDVQVWPIDEDNIEISFTAAPDAGVSLSALQLAFEASLSDVANNGIPEATYSRVKARFDGYWPDWDDEDETARWMADYVLDRVSNLREPLSERELKRLHRALSLDATNEFLQKLAGEGRTAVAVIGPEDSFE